MTTHDAAIKAIARAIYTAEENLEDAQRDAADAMTSDEMIADLREKAAAARLPLKAVTTGPRGGDHWYICDADGDTIAYISANDGSDEGERGPRAELIVAAVNALPALLDEIERLRAERDDAVREMHARELHHFEMEQELERLRTDTPEQDAERATVLDMANAILEARAGQIGTHYETCWMNHVGCFAARIQLALAKEKTP